MKKILFQGDSITDCGRAREDDISLGAGYALLVKAHMSYERPGKYEYYNRGISCNRIVDLYARIKKDIINLAPDYLSILIGVNDAGADLCEKRDGVDAEKFEKIYSMLIEEIQAALPNVKIMIMEPFCLKGSRTDNTNEDPKRWEIYSGEVRKRAQKARAVAEKYHIPFVELQNVFEQAAEKEGNTYWVRDGVHPTAAGHELIKREWIKAFELYLQTK